MNLYDRYVLPRLLALVMRQELFVPFRRRIGAEARGRVLEIGIGSGLNLPFYGAGVREVIGVDPSPVLLGFARDRAAGLKVNLAVREGAAEMLPFEDAGFDTVVTTWSLCTIGDPVAALREARRVLAPGGGCCSRSMGCRRMRRWRGGRTALRRCGNMWRAAAIPTGRSIG